MNEASNRIVSSQKSANKTNWRETNKATKKHKHSGERTSMASLNARTLIAEAAEAFAAGASDAGFFTTTTLFKGAVRNM